MAYSLIWDVNININNFSTEKCAFERAWQFTIASRMLGGGGSGETMTSGSSLQMEQSVQQSTSHHHQFGASPAYKAYGSRNSTVSTAPSLGIFWLKNLAFIRTHRTN